MSSRFGPTVQGGRGGDAKAIAQRNLDKVAEGILADDFDAFLDHVGLPLVTATARGLQRFATRASLELAFRHLTAASRALGVTRVESVAETVVEYGRGQMLRTHVTRLWNGDTLARAPHAGLTVLGVHDGQWRLARAQIAVSEAAPAGMGFDLVPGADEDHAEIAAVFAEALDRMTRALLEGDFDLLCDATRRPLFLQNMDGTVILRDVEALRSNFDCVLADFRMHGITDVVRVVKRARRLCDRRVQGLYRTHVLCGQMLALPSFMSVMTLERGEDGVWRTAEIMHPLNPLTLARNRPAA